MWQLCRIWHARGAGIIGMPNVGKSTLFNALTCSQQAKTANYPFCTIDANLSKAPVVDNRLRRLAAFTQAKKVVDVEVELADVAGLIAGASKGAGLGNKFLADIRSCKVLLHMIRCFVRAEDGFDTPTPLQDVDTIMNELILSDAEVMERRLTRAKRGRAAAGGGEVEMQFMLRVADALNDGKPAREVRCAHGHEEQWLGSYDLLSYKPMMLVLNVEEEAVREGNAYSRAVEQRYGNDRQTCRVSAAIEEQTAQLSSREERLAFLQAYDLDEPVGEVLLRQVMSDMLNMHSFFTVGPQMAHAWSIPQGATVREAASVIHSDFGKHFRRARVMSWSEMITKPNLAAAELQMEHVNERYIVQDGDVLIIDHNAPRA